MRILVVDDDADMRSLCERTLRSARYEVSAAASGDAAAARLDEGWDIVLTDIMMPGQVDGNELLRLARSKGSGDVILMAGDPECDSAIAAIKDGAFDFLPKPFSQDMLLVAVRRCAEKRALSKELAQEKALRCELHQSFAQLARLHKVQETFGQFVTPEIVQFTLGNLEYFKKSSRMTVTILFADIRRFTSFAGRAAPEEVVCSLNELLARFIDAVHREGGIVNKFMGDGAMAIFGAPLAHKDPAQAAARAALWTRDAVERLAIVRRGLGLEVHRFGFGMNTGEVVAGCLGTMERTEYTVIGHAVNVASRLEHAASAGQILIGPDTATLLDGRFKLGKILPLDLAGVLDPISADELLGFSETVEKGALSYKGQKVTTQVPRHPFPRWTHTHL